MIESLSISSGDCRINAKEELDLWLESSLNLLRDIYHKKLHEIDQLYDKLNKNLEDYKQRQSMTISQQKTDLLKQELEQLHTQLPTLIQV